MFIMYWTLWRYFHPLYFIENPKIELWAEYSKIAVVFFDVCVFLSGLSTASDLYCSLAEITYQKHPTL